MMMSNNTNPTTITPTNLGKATSTSSAAALEFQAGTNQDINNTSAIDCVPFINTSWMTPLPTNNNSNNSNNSNNQSGETSIATPAATLHVTMPVNQAALEAAVYGSTGASSTGLSTNPYSNPMGYGNSAATYNSYNYQMALRNAAPNYFNTLGSASAVAATAANPASYYSGYYTPGFDYNPYATSNQYYNNSSRSAVAAVNNYCNAAAAASFSYGALGTESLPTSSSSSSAITASSRVSPYSISQKPDHKPPRRTKKKKPTGGLASPEQSYDRVFVYELEDLCSFIQPPQYFAHFGILLENIINLAFGIHVDECDQVNVEDANVDEITDLAYQTNPGGDPNIPDEKPDINSLSAESPTLNAVNRGIADGLQQMARRYQRMKEVYNKCKDNIGELKNYMPEYSSDQIIGWIKQHEVFVENYRQCLRIAIERRTEKERFTNVIISSDSLASTMAKLLLCNLASYVPVENIYSCHKIGKAEIFERASLRFKNKMLIASSLPETQELAKKDKIPFWPIRALKDIDTLYFALDKHLIGF